MFRKGKFRSNQSYKRPFFVAPLRDRNGKLHGGGSSKSLKRETNRKVRRMPLEAVPGGGAYKRLIEVWDYNGDLSKLHYYIGRYPGEDETDHVVTKGGNRYFPK